jgi:hypothetical protein
VISIPPDDENFLRAAKSAGGSQSIRPGTFDSKFEIKTTAHKQAEWRKNLAARGESRKS